MTLNILLCGFGAFGQQHAAAWKVACPEHKLLVADLDQGRRDLAMQSGCRPDNVCADYKRLLSKADIVDIVTTSESHFDIAMVALSSGKPTLIEKPAVKKIGQAVALDRKARNCNLPVQVQFVLRAHPLVREAQKLMKKGAIGRLVAMDANFTGWKRMRLDATILENDGVHMLDLMHLFSQSSTDSFDIAGDKLFGGEVPETVHVRLEFSNKIIGWLRLGIAFGGKQRDDYTFGSLTTKTFTLIGDSGSIELDFNADTLEFAEITYHPTDAGFTPEIKNLTTRRCTGITPVVLLTECFKQFTGALNKKNEVICDLSQGAVEITKILDDARERLAAQHEL